MNGGLGKMSRYLLAGASVIGLLAIGAPEAKAQNLQEIQAQIDQMQATIKALQKQVQDAKAQASAAQTTADSAKGSDLDLKVKWKGAPELSSGDGKFKMKVRGRLETDYNHVNQDTRITTFPDVSATELAACTPRRRRHSVLRLEIRRRSRFRQRRGPDEGRLSRNIRVSRSMTNPLLLRVGNFKTLQHLRRRNQRSLRRHHGACGVHQRLGHRAADRLQ